MTVSISATRTVNHSRPLRVAFTAIAVVLTNACASAIGPSDAGDGAVDVRRPEVIEQPLGAQCYPARPPLQPGSPRCGADAGCFRGDENYLEIDTLECASRRCLVYYWDESRFPTRGDRAFCTCRCGGMGAPGPFCPCPSGFRCTSIFTFGSPDFIGSYCVPERVL